ncbi:hypothetical protein [Marinitoga sp. 1155]|uniref:hypothetical protein n=1 Tax=Marinitoga sp. 1155 TaxID=1428448 RepID=UPI00064132DF|nr:hypothetical protein [Marinitoga sp. 1155]KLO21580.1 hypothetical protein X274_10195 [Marinitoga sp. 1155]
MPETFLKNDINIKTSEYYTKDDILVFKNYFENGELTKQEIFDNKGNIDYTFEIKDEKIYSIKNSDGQKVSTNKIYYYYNNISHTKESLPLNKIFTFEDYLNSAKNKKEKFSLYDQLDPGQYTYGYRIDTVEAGPTIGQISSDIFSNTVDYLTGVLTNKLISIIAKKLEPIKDLIQYGNDFYSYLKNNFKIEKKKKFQEWRREQKRIYVIHYISNRNGKWIKSWEKIFAIAELHYANVIVEIKGRSYYKYYNYGVYETRSEPAERKEVKRNVKEIKSLNYGNHSKLLLIAKENYFTYINNGTYYVWYEIP